MKKYLIHFIAVAFLAFFATSNLHGQKNVTKPSIKGPEGFRINSFTGSLFYDRQDVKIQSNGPDLDFRFSYKSSSKHRDVGYGHGWTFSYGMYYKIDTTTTIVTVIGTQGGSKKFYLDGDIYRAEPGVFDKFEEYEAGKFVITSKTGKKCFFDDSVSKKVTKIEDRCNNSLTLSYTDSLLTQVTDDTGRAIQLSWTDGHLTTITNSLLSEPRVYSYDYDDNGNMVLYTDPLSNTVEYVYDEKHRLGLVVDQMSIPTRIAYQQSGGVKKIASCDYSFSISYNPSQNRTYVVQEVESERLITTYQFDPNGDIMSKQGNCCGYNVSYVYDDDKNVVKRTNGNDDATLVAYDDNGNPLTVSDPMGNSKEFTYDDNYSNVLSQQDEDGNETTYDYDPKGNVTTINHPLGITESFTYDQVGNILSETNGNGHTTTYEYDQFGYLAKIINPDNTFSLFQHDAVGNLISSTDENGNVNTYEYDALDRALKLTNPLGHETNMVYDERGNLLELIDAKGNSTTYVYDGLRQTLSQTTAMGNTTQYVYDADGNRIAMIDGEGNKSTMKYNIRNQLIEQTDISGNVIFFEYDAVGNKIAQSDKSGNTMTMEYNKNNRLVKSTDPIGNFTQYVYDAQGRKTQVIDPNGNVSTIEYDALSRISKKTDGLGNSEEYTYDGAGNKLTKKDKNGNIETYFYNNRNQLVKIINALEEEVEFVYDAVGNEIQSIAVSTVILTKKYNELNLLAQQINALNDTTYFEYDALNLLIKEISPKGNTFYSEYDLDNRLVKKYDNVGIISETTYNTINQKLTETDGNSMTTIYGYDQLNRLVQKTFSSGAIETFEYDVNNRLVKQIDKGGNSTTYTYNNLGQVVTTINSLGQTTSVAYDAVGNTTSINDARGNITLMSYDALNRPYRTQYPDGTTKSYVFDANGNLIERIDGAGNVTQMAYDELNRQIAKTYPNGNSCTFSFDQLGRMISANNENSELDFTYDLLDRIMSETVDGTDVISYSYDMPNREVEITYPTGRVVKEIYDVRNRPTEIQQNTEMVSSFTYDGVRMIQQDFANSLMTNLTYNSNGLPQSITTNPNQVFNYNISYDEYFNMTSQEAIHNSAFSETYEYDQLNRLVGFKKGELVNEEILSPSFQTVFDYDELGNRKTITENNNTISYQTNSMNAYTSVTDAVGTNNFQYSQTGNLISTSTNTYSFDTDNRLIGVGDDIIYKYDALGRRFEKGNNNTTTKYYYSMAQVIVEKQGTNTKEYIYAGRTEDRFLAVIENDETHYFHMNSVGSIIGMTNSNGDVVERYEYSPYGKVQYFDGSFSPLTSSSIGNRFLYTGKELDLESGLYYSRARYYDSNLGRFIQRDPMGFVDGMNMYQYVSSNPINYIDPLGLRKTCNQFSISTEISNPIYKGLLSKLNSKKGSGKNGVVGKQGFSASIDMKRCHGCCEKTNKDGVSYEWRMSANANLSQELNLVTFTPLGRLKKLYDKFSAKRTENGSTLLVGGELNISVSGGADFQTDFCGNKSGGGCLSLKGNLFLGVRIKTDDDNVGTPVHGSNSRQNYPVYKPSLSVGVGGGIYGEGSFGACYDPQQGWNCNYSINVELQAFIYAEGSWMGMSFSRREEIQKTLYNKTGNLCPASLPNP